MSEIDKLKTILLTLDTPLSSEDLTKALEAALFLILKIEMETGTDLTDIRAEVQKFQDKLDKVETTPGPKPIAGVDFPFPENGYTPIKGKDYFDGKDYVLQEEDKKEIASLIKVPVVEKIIEKTEVIREQPIITNEIKEVAIPTTGEEMVDKINDLPIEPDFQIDSDHIKGLKEELKNLKGIVSEARPIFGPGKTKILIMDLSSQLDGVTKTFNVGTNFGIVGVYSSSAPFIFRPTIDFTAVGQTIVFDSSIDAASMLAGGQSLIIQYLR